jgi:hypothetical protein
MSSRFKQTVPEGTRNLPDATGLLENDRQRYSVKNNQPWIQTCQAQSSTLSGNDSYFPLKVKKERFINQKQVKHDADTSDDQSTQVFPPLPYSDLHCKLLPLQSFVPAVRICR